MTLRYGGTPSFLFLFPFPKSHLSATWDEGFAQDKTLLHSKVEKLRPCLAEAPCSSLLPSEGSGGSSARQQAFVL